MRSLWSVVRIMLRAAIWRTTPDPVLVGLPTLLLWMITLAALRIALQFVAAGPGGAFNPYGLNAVVASLALEAVVAALFVRPGARVTALPAMFALLVIANLAADAARIAAALLPAADTAHRLLTVGAAPVATFAAVSVWWIGAMVAVLRSFAPQPPARGLARATALWVALMAVTALVPHVPVFVGRGFDIRNANWWETLHARLEGSAPHAAAPSEAALEPAQPALLQTEIAGLAPRAKDGVNVYALGVAGWASQDVFRKELDGALTKIGEILPIKGHTLRLINQRATVKSLPLADRQNFAAAVHALAAAMDKTGDVLLLLMTSHGEPTGFGLQFPNTVIGQLTPRDVATVLDREGIKNRVVIVSACFAGIFVPPLANDDTIVLTAADAKSTSFGCAPGRDWTYFGDAFFRQSVKPGRDFRQAFDNARVLIQGWELMDRAAPSDPQAHFGPALVAKLAPFFASQSGLQH